MIGRDIRPGGHRRKQIHEYVDRRQHGGMVQNRTQKADADLAAKIHVCDRREPQYDKTPFDHVQSWLLELRAGQSRILLLLLRCGIFHRMMTVILPAFAGRGCVPMTQDDATRADSAKPDWEAGAGEPRVGRPGFPSVPSFYSLHVYR